MQTFLDYVAKKIAFTSHKWADIKVIVPNKRAIIFLKESFKKVIDRPIIAPKILTVEEFINDIKPKPVEYFKELLDGDDSKRIVTRHWSIIDNQFYDFYIKDYA